MKKSLKTWLIILGVLALVIVVPMLSNNNSYLKKISYERFETLLESEEFTMIYVGQKNCSHCENMKPALSDINKNYQTNINYLDYSKLTDEQRQEIKTITKSENEGTPTFIFVKGGEVIDSQVGESSKDDFLKKYSEAYSYVGKTYYKVVTAAEFVKAYKNKSTDVFVIGQTTCGHCTNYKPTINKMARENDVVINYIDYNTLTSDEQKEIGELDKRFDSFGTPLTLIVKKGKILDEISGNTDYDTLYKKLKEYDLVD